MLALVVYNAVTSLWGWPSPRPAPRGRRSTRFRVVVPAHDEATVIGGVLADLRTQDHPTPLTTIWVIADRCQDDTAAIATAAGAAVDERRDGSGGKGAALEWHLDRHPLGDDEMLVVIDADNRIPSGLLSRFADEADAGHEALQAYLDVTNPDASVLATAGAVSYWASNRMVQQARQRLGWPADLGGTGMAITASALTRAGGFGPSLTEDVDLGVRLALSGIPVRWLHDIHIHDEKPHAVGVVIRQRARWAAGKRSVARRHLGALLTAAVRRRSAGLLDLAIRLVQPSRTMVAALSGAALVLAATLRPWWLFSPEVWAIATAIQLLMPIPFLLRDGIPPRYVIRYPALVLLATLWIPIRILSRLTRVWYHTPHEGGSTQMSDRPRSPQQSPPEAEAVAEMHEGGGEHHGPQQSG